MLTIHYDDTWGFLAVSGENGKTILNSGKSLHTLFMMAQLHGYKLDLKAAGLEIAYAYWSEEFSHEYCTSGMTIVNLFRRCYCDDFDQAGWVTGKRARIYRTNVWSSQNRNFGLRHTA